MSQSSPFQNPDQSALREILASIKTIALVGYSPKPERASHRVAHGLKSLGYRVIAVRPQLAEALGETAYASLRDIPFAVDIVDVFRNPNEIAPIIDDAIAIGAPRLWLQDGVINLSEAQRAQAAGMQVVMDRCLWRDANQLR